MDLETLEEELGNILINGFVIEKDKKGRVIIITGLIEKSDGELSFLDDEDMDDDLQFEVEDDFSLDDE